MLTAAALRASDEANEVLHRFLPRFNEKFGVPAEHSSVAAAARWPAKLRASERETTASSKERMDLLELLRKEGMDGDVDFLREALRVLVEGIMDAGGVIEDRC